MCPDYPDVGFTPEYQKLFADTAFGGKPRCFSSDGIEYRYYLRDIPGTEHKDIASPYGYSGPCPISQAPNWAWFVDQFHVYCQRYDIVSEFARLHPWEIGGPYAGHYEREIMYIDLTQTEEQIWKGFDKGCRGALNKDTSWNIAEGISSYFPVWYQDDRTANEDYVFGDAFFNRARQLPVWTSSNRTAEALFLKHGDYCHYWLSVGKNTNSAIWGAILWAKGQGCKIFNLGGGLKAGDSLEHFKRSFSATTKPFYTYRKIHNQEIYDELCKAKGVDPQSGGFFPAYRR